MSSTLVSKYSQGATKASGSRKDIRGSRRLTELGEGAFDTYLKQQHSVSVKEFESFVELIWANAFEQLLQPDAEKAALTAEKDVFEATQHLVSEEASKTYRSLYLKQQPNCIE